MSKKHDAIFDDVLSDLAEDRPEPRDRGGARFLKRSTTIGDRLSGELEEKTLRWVDPVDCRMWDRHNREYSLLTEDNCRDLIDGIKSQGRQEFPAIVRRAPAGSEQPYEVICGARRHFAVSWLRANNYPQFKYLIELRELTDEEAFRLADIENRDREDISDFERARDYAAALKLYYNGRQTAMAERLEVTPTWLSRYLQLAKLPAEVVAAFPSIREIRELHARQLKPLLTRPQDRDRLMAAAAELAQEQRRAREGQGSQVETAEVLRRLKGGGEPVPAKKVEKRIFRRDPHESGVTMIRRGAKVSLEFNASLSREALVAGIDAFLAECYGQR